MAWEEDFWWEDIATGDVIKAPSPAPWEIPAPISHRTIRLNEIPWYFEDGVWKRYDERGRVILSVKVMPTFDRNAHWTTKDGRRYKVCEMDTRHIRNCIAWFKRKKDHEREPFYHLFVKELEIRELREP
jgi:hypothetical protein